MKALRLLATLIALAVIAGVMGVGFGRRLQHLRQSEGASFVMLEAGRPVRFAVGDTPWVELISRTGSGNLLVHWLGEGPVDTTVSPGTGEMGRTLRLAVPPLSSAVEFTAEREAAVQVRGATPATRAGSLRRLAFLASQREALAWTWKSLPPDGTPEVRRWPHLDAPPPLPTPAASREGSVALAARQSRGWLVKGPAELGFEWAGAQPAHVSLGGAHPVELDVPPGTASLTVPDGLAQLEISSAEAGHLTWRPSSSAQPAPVSTERPQRVWLLVPGQQLRFQLDASGGLALRLSSWLLHPAPEGGHLRWRLGTTSGTRALSGTPAEATCQASADGCAPVGQRDESFLAAAAQPQAELALSSDAALLVAVDTQWESGADPRLRPPFDEAPEGFEWEGAPPRASRWVFVRPVTEASSMTLMHSTKLVPSAPRAPRPTMTFEPTGAQRSAVVLEPAAGRATAFVPISPGAEREVLVDATGARAHRLGVSCLSTAIGGTVTLLVDGASVGQKIFTSNDLLLEALTSPGPHRVKVDAPASARCHLNARAAGGGWRKRTVYPVTEDGLEWSVKTSSTAKSRVVSFAIYGSASALGPAAALRVTIDGGRLQRVSGAPEQITIGLREIPLGGRAPLEVKTLAGTRAFDRLGIIRVVLGDDLPPGLHRVSLKGVDTGALALRSWTDGHRAKPERAEGWITTEDTP